MRNDQLIQSVRKFFIDEEQKGKNLITYKGIPNFKEFQRSYKIGVDLDRFKEIIIEEDTGLELGGINKKSISLILSIQELDIIEDRKITLLGREIDSITEKSTDFGIFVLIGIKKNLEKDLEEIRQLNFISNSIEGFLIRTIPRKFWCRISSEVIKKGFSFRFLGSTIQHLYKAKYGSLISAIEIFFINSYPESIDRFKEIASEIFLKFKEKWKTKIEDWKKKVDCEYDWGCGICPYREECYKIKQALIKREDLDY